MSSHPRVYVVEKFATDAEMDHVMRKVRNDGEAWSDYGPLRALVPCSPAGTEKRQTLTTRGLMARRCCEPSADASISQHADEFAKYAMLVGKEIFGTVTKGPRKL